MGRCTQACLLHLHPWLGSRRNVCHFQGSNDQLPDDGPSVTLELSGRVAAPSFNAASGSAIGFNSHFKIGSFNELVVLGAEHDPRYGAGVSPLFRGRDSTSLFTVSVNSIGNMMTVLDGPAPSPSIV